MKLKTNEEAVSPVIGVILMVAITVVLAAVVFVLVQGVSVGNEPAPNLALASDGDGNWTVIAADDGLKWADLNAPDCDALPTGNVTAGDKITGCADGWVLVHTPSNSVIFRDS